ncbi:hypothetical protein ANACOL_01232 [Anaerotruncus colihominis DSM 17241]|uniref:Uncharacterized protein n=1 Tax=Anaerotruncus colihominis DSM 17241 TaxID=445972 RepID=B0P8Y6_9FIRM|nr:hypothetical protein ANACOL_01232 [Anaerotruncus colihominis DSM 17241]
MTSPRPRQTKRQKLNKNSLPIILFHKNSIAFLILDVNPKPIQSTFSKNL